jgi:hypothetical protein
MATENCLPTSDVATTLQATPLGSRYTCVDDPVGSPDDTDYVSVPAGFSNADIYGFSHAVPAGSTINSVAVVNRVWIDASSAYSMVAAHLKVGGTVYTQTSFGTLGSWAAGTKTWATNPKTGVAWTYDSLATIDGFGIYLQTETGKTRTKCSQSYLVIDYTPGSGGTSTRRAVAVLL